MSALPPGWADSTIGDIAEYISRGKSPKYTDLSELPVVNQRAIRWFGIQDEHLKYIHPDQFESWSEERFIQDGDTLWNSTGRGTLGRACLVQAKHLIPPKVVDSHVTIVRPVKGLIEPRYLFAWIRSPQVQNSIEDVATGTTNQIELRKSTVAATHIPIAPLNEQRRIAEKLDSLTSGVDSCRERLDRVPFILKRFRQSVLADATSGKLTEEWRAARGLTAETHSFEFADADVFQEFVFPQSWDQARLSDITEISSGVTKDSKKQFPEFVEVPYLRVANVQRGFFDLTEMKTIRVPQKKLETLLLEPGDILFNEGGDIDKLGRGWVWNGEITPCVFQNHVFRARLKDSHFFPKFFSWYGNSRGPAYFLSRGKQTTNLASINKSVLSALPVPIPPIEEQSEIVSRVNALFSFADLLDARCAAASDQVEKLTPTLLTKAFRGELVPQNPNDEPASTLLERIRAEQALQPKKPQRTIAGRKPKMAKITTESVREVIRQLPQDRFTFDELCVKVTAEYDTLKDIVFELLGAETPSLKQVFDTERQTMQFERVEK